MWEAAKALWEQEWEPVSQAAGIGWLAFYGLFFLHALTDVDGFLAIDHVNLIVHEAVHLLFGWLGPTAGLWGGTLMELLVPLALAVHFRITGRQRGRRSRHTSSLRISCISHCT